MTGGKGLNQFRERMLTDKHLRNIVDYPKLYEAFPGVKIEAASHIFCGMAAIKGRVKFKLFGMANPRDQQLHGTLMLTTFLFGGTRQCLSSKRSKWLVSQLDTRVSSGKPFGFRTFFHGKPSA
jgi:site-specific DNA-methyltransferase (adenine-specific)